ncbi:MAG: amidohydrolase family protein [Pseudomonadota bacterium]
MKRKSLADIIIVNGDVFTADKSNPHFCPGAIAIKDGVIEAVGDEKDILPAFEAASRIDACLALVHPGFIDTHLHATGIAYHGAPFAPTDPADSKLNYSQLKCSTNEKITAAYTAAAACSLLQRGFTMFMEAGTVFETDAFAETLQDCGMRGLVSAPFGWDDIAAMLKRWPGMMPEQLVDRAPADADRTLDQLNKELKRNMADDGLVRGYVCLYGEGTATDDLTKEAVKLARDNGVVYYQHQSFLPVFAEAEKKARGDTGAVRLNRLGALDTNTTLAHMNYLSEEDVDILLATRPGLVWCPNNGLNHGVTPPHRCWFPSLHRQGLSVSLGVDTTLAHPIGISGLISLYLSANIGERLDSADPFHMQTIAAANNIGMGDRLGSLTPGKRADIVIRERRDITQTSWEDTSGILLSLSSAMIPVDTVLIDGRVVMAEGRLTTRDQDEILATAIRQRDKLAERLMQ